MSDVHSASCVYGPVKSWRWGRSLGVDLLLVDSICTFRCQYCQLGKIGRPTSERGIFVPTAKVIEDLRAGALDEADVVTFSGNGEPTLAENLGECLAWLAAHSLLPRFVLTNGTLLDLPEVRRDLELASRVSVKLDAATEATFERINRPVAGVSLARVIAGTKSLRAEFTGHLSLQVMVMNSNVVEMEAIAEIAKTIRPDSIELNLPKRPVPFSWHVGARGNHGETPVEAAHIALVKDDQVATILRQFEHICAVPVHCSLR